MKKTGIIIFASALVIGLVVSNIFSFSHEAHKLFNFSFNFGGEKGSGKIVTEKRSLSGFKGVDVGGVFQVEITAGKEFAVEIETDDNLLPLIKTEVNNGVLEIELERHVSPSGKILVRISAPDISELDVSGAANVTLNAVKNSNLAVEASGAAKLKIAGQTAKLTVESSGASKIDADDLRTENATIEGSGASHIELNVSGELNADLSGASHVTYSGTPTAVHKTTTGAGSVSQK
jgi:hypothetical protein